MNMTKALDYGAFNPTHMTKYTEMFKQLYNQLQKSNPEYNNPSDAFAAGIYFGAGMMMGKEYNEEKQYGNVPKHEQDKHCMTCSCKEGQAQYYGGLERKVHDKDKKY